MTESTNPLLGLGADDAFTVTNSGERFYYAKFHPGDIVFNDIACHLAHTCRWLGALGRHYSTAEHSVIMAQYALVCSSTQLPKYLRWEDPAIQAIQRKTFAKALLFHDAEEYVTGDFPSPLKQFFNPLFEQYAGFVREAIYKKYDVHYPYYVYVKEWDKRMLFTEAFKFLPGGTKAIMEPGKGITPSLAVTLHGWNAQTAQERFKDMYLRLI